MVARVLNIAMLSAVRVSNILWLRLFSLQVFYTHALRMQESYGFNNYELPSIAV